MHVLKLLYLIEKLSDASENNKNMTSEELLSIRGDPLALIVKNRNFFNRINIMKDQQDNDSIKDSKNKMNYYFNSTVDAEYEWKKYKLFNSINSICC